MIFYLSEDECNSPFIKLFNDSYGGEPLIGTDGNQNLLDAVCFAAEGGNQVIVYMDMVPGNKKLLTIYRDIFDLYYKRGIDVVVLPIVCSEYAFIRSVEGLDGPIRLKTGLEEVLSKSVSYANSEIARRNHLGPNKTFEKFCKLFCKVCMRSCCSTTGSASDIKEKDYYRDDCGVGSECKRCQLRLRLIEKSGLYVQQFPVVPSGCASIQTYTLSWSDVIAVSHRLVDEYNCWSDSYGKGYRHIRKRISI